MIFVMSSDAPLGLYDSGLGGLTVWQTMRELLPLERVVYYGDTAHVPYGGRTPEEILCFSQEIISFLLERGVKAVIAACNTSSALALPRLHAILPVPLIGMIEPAVEEAMRITRNGRIGLMATEGTVRSGAHARVLQAQAPAYQLIGQACPSLVPLIEAGHRSGRILQEAVEQCIKPLLVAGVDCIILGCTHYPLIRAQIQAAAGDIPLIDPARAVTVQTAQVLQRADLVNSSGSGADAVFVSGDPHSFAKSASDLPFDLRATVQAADTCVARVR